MTMRALWLWLCVAALRWATGPGAGVHALCYAPAGGEHSGPVTYTNTTGYMQIVDWDWVGGDVLTIGSPEDTTLHNCHRRCAAAAPNYDFLVVAPGFYCYCKLYANTATPTAKQPYAPGQRVSSPRPGTSVSRGYPTSVVVTTECDATVGMTPVMPATPVVCQSNGVWGPNAVPRRPTCSACAVIPGTALGGPASGVYTPAQGHVVFREWNWASIDLTMTSGAAGTFTVPACHAYCMVQASSYEFVVVPRSLHQCWCKRGLQGAAVDANAISSPRPGVTVLGIPPAVPIGTECEAGYTPVSTTAAARAFGDTRCGDNGRWLDPATRPVCQRTCPLTGGSALAGPTAWSLTTGHVRLTGGWDWPGTVLATSTNAAHATGVTACHAYCAQTASAYAFVSVDIGTRCVCQTLNAQGSTHTAMLERASNPNRMGSPRPGTSMPVVPNGVQIETECDAGAGYAPDSSTIPASAPTCGVDGTWTGSSTRASCRNSAPITGCVLSAGSEQAGPLVLSGVTGYAVVGGWVWPGAVAASDGAAASWASVSACHAYCAAAVPNYAFVVLRTTGPNGAACECRLLATAPASTAPSVDASAQTSPQPGTTLVDVPFGVTVTTACLSADDDGWYSAPADSTAPLQCTTAGAWTGARTQCHRPCSVGPTTGDADDGIGIAGPNAYDPAFGHLTLPNVYWQTQALWASELTALPYGDTLDVRTCHRECARLLGVTTNTAVAFGGSVAAPTCRCGTWTTTSPPLSAARLTTATPPSADGVVSLAPGAVFARWLLPGTTAGTACPSGWTLSTSASNGSTVSTCRVDGTWSNARPVCTPPPGTCTLRAGSVLGGPRTYDVTFGHARVPGVVWSGSTLDAIDFPVAGSSGSSASARTLHGCHTWCRAVRPQYELAVLTATQCVCRLHDSPDVPLVPASAADALASVTSPRPGVALRYVPAATRVDTECADGWSLLQSVSGDSGVTVAPNTCVAGVGSAVATAAWGGATTRPRCVQPGTGSGGRLCALSQRTGPITADTGIAFVHDGACPNGLVLVTVAGGVAATPYSCHAWCASLLTATATSGATVAERAVMGGVATCTCRASCNGVVSYAAQSQVMPIAGALTGSSDSSSGSGSTTLFVPHGLQQRVSCSLSYTGGAHATCNGNGADDSNSSGVSGVWEGTSVCDVAVCDSAWCVNGGTCVDEPGSAMSCVCPAAWTGTRCETAAASAACASQPCRNGGTCTVVSGSGGYACACATGWSGPDCTTPTLDDRSGSSDDGGGGVSAATIALIAVPSAVALACCVVCVACCVCSPRVAAARERLKAGLGFGFGSTAAPTSMLGPADDFDATAGPAAAAAAPPPGAGASAGADAAPNTDALVNVNANASAVAGAAVPVPVASRAVPVRVAATATADALPPAGAVPPGATAGPAVASRAGVAYGATDAKHDATDYRDVERAAASGGFGFAWPHAPVAAPAPAPAPAPAHAAAQPAAHAAAPARSRRSGAAHGHGDRKGKGKGKGHGNGQSKPQAAAPA